MRTNTKTIERTHEGAKAKRTNPEQALRRSVLSCMLFEDTFYESGQSIAYRIEQGVRAVDNGFAHALALEARTHFKLRHVPLLIAKVLAEQGYSAIAECLDDVIQRADECSEFLSLWWAGGKRPIPNQVKKGLANALCKFDEYQLAKYNARKGDAITLKDVLRMVHPVPSSADESEKLRKLAKDELASPETWEQQLSRGDDKAKVFTDLISDGKLGAMAVLRNLRNMIEAGVSKNLIVEAIERMNAARVLPLRFVSADLALPSDTDSAIIKAVERKFMDSCRALPVLRGTTAICVDTSGSMKCRISGQSKVRGEVAAASLAAIASGCCENFIVIQFGTRAEEIRAYEGMELVRHIRSRSGACGYGTNIGVAVALARSSDPDRIIVVTDMQSHTNVSFGGVGGYYINVQPYRNAVDYDKGFVEVNGFSEHTLKWITEFEQESDNAPQ